jgi:hypothetical protein
MQTAFLILIGFSIGTQLSFEFTSDSLKVTASPAAVALAKRLAQLIASLAQRGVGQAKGQAPLVLAKAKQAIADQLHPTEAPRLEAADGRDLGEVGPLQIIPAAKVKPAKGFMHPTEGWQTSGVSR